MIDPNFIGVRIFTKLIKGVIIILSGWILDLSCIDWFINYKGGLRDYAPNIFKS